MNEFGLSLMRLMDEKDIPSLSEFVDRMNKCNRRKTRRGCPYYSVGDVVAFMRAERSEDLPRRQEISISSHMGEALGLDNDEEHERIYQPIIRSISVRYRDRWPKE
jgi:hypothetical protein